MNGFFAAGLNYKTTPLEVRERFSVAPDRLRSAIRHLGERFTLSHWCPVNSWFEIYNRLNDKNLYRQVGVSDFEIELGAVASNYQLRYEFRKAHLLTSN